MMARRRPKKGQPASKGYREAKKLRAKAHKKVARQREDTGRKWAKKVVRDHDAIAVEDFRPKFLARTTMARKAADAAIGATKAALIEMGRKHGRDIRLVHPAHTTMDCAHCDARAKHRLPLGERTYTCTACGNVSPRDKNSARVMLVRAGLNPAGADGARPQSTVKVSFTFSYVLRACVSVSGWYQVLIWYDLSPALKPSSWACQGTPSRVKVYSHTTAG